QRTKKDTAAAQPCVDVRHTFVGNRESHAAGRRHELDGDAPVGEEFGRADAVPEASAVVDDDGALRNVRHATAEQVPDGDNRRVRSCFEVRWQRSGTGGAHDEIGLVRQYGLAGGARAEADVDPEALQLALEVKDE